MMKIKKMRKIKMKMEKEVKKMKKLYDQAKMIKIRVKSLLKQKKKSNSLQ